MTNHPLPKRATGADRSATNTAAGGSSEDAQWRELTRLLQQHRQSHLLRWWHDLRAHEQTELAAQIRQVDFEQLDRLWTHTSNAPGETSTPDNVTVPHTVTAGSDRHSQVDARTVGERLLRDGRTGVLIVAGGQGSRLGFPGPKGCFPIGPVVGTTLYQILLEKVVAASRQYEVAIPVYLMTSPATHEETVCFLQQHDWFGISPHARHVFCQGTMPVVDFANRVLMQSRSRLCLGPDGHGGIIPALQSSGLLEAMARSGVEHLFYCQIDNAAAPLLEPTLIGLHALENSEVTLLVTEKSSPDEKVGTVVSIDGQTHVLEYTLIPSDIARQRGEDGRLRFRAANTGMHILDTAFLSRCAANAKLLPFHRAIKSVSHIDTQEQHITPTEPNAVKYERFIFDAFPLATRSLLIEVDQESTFLPLKEARSTTTSAEGVQRQLSLLYRRWLIETGIELPDGIRVEISPLYARTCRDVALRLRETGGQLRTIPQNGTLYLDDPHAPALNVAAANQRQRKSA